jgi:hypothetical protein
VAADAIMTFKTGNMMRDHHAIADLEILGAPSEFYNVAGDFVPEGDRRF